MCSLTVYLYVRTKVQLFSANSFYQVLLSKEFKIALTFKVRKLCSVLSVMTSEVQRTNVNTTTSNECQAVLSN